MIRAYVKKQILEAFYFLPQLSIFLQPDEDLLNHLDHSFSVLRKFAMEGKKMTMT